MNPVIVIPTYWEQNQAGMLVPGQYDHATNISDQNPDLDRCLQSLEQVHGIIRIAVLVVCPLAQTEAVRLRVNQIVGKHPTLPVTIITNKEVSAIVDKIETIAPDLTGEVVSLRGYGAIRNVGLAIASIMGHDSVVFIDDDEIITTSDFLDRAMYGLGYETRSSLPILAKTGFFYDKDGSPLANTEGSRTCDKWWTKRLEFNEWMKRALTTTRISRSNYVCGGCMVLHARAYMHIPFDPYITRGEDLDYLFNLRINGLDMWFDNRWNVHHYPPASPDSAPRFMQDVYRWYYERAKIRETNNHIELHQVTAASLMPYPGPWFSDQLDERIAKTSLARMLTTKEHLAYFKVWSRGRFDAKEYAQKYKRAYLRLQNFWSSIMNLLWRDEALLDMLTNPEVSRNTKYADEESSTKRGSSDD